MTGYSKDISPVGWYVASYLLRFVELDDPGNNDPNQEFPTWENTIIVKADSLDGAYRKVIAIAEMETTPYKGGDQGIPVQWVLEGITELLPIYEPLEDGTEIMWAEHEPRKLSEIRHRARSLEDMRERLAASKHR